MGSIFRSAACLSTAFVIGSFAGADIVYDESAVEALSDPGFQPTFIDFTEGVNNVLFVTDRGSDRDIFTFSIAAGYELAGWCSRSSTPTTTAISPSCRSPLVPSCPSIPRIRIPASCPAMRCLTRTTSVPTSSRRWEPPSGPSVTAVRWVRVTTPSGPRSRHRPGLLEPRVHRHPDPDPRSDRHLRAGRSRRKAATRLTQPRPTGITATSPAALP